MRSSVFGKWVISRKWKSYILLPGSLSLGLMALYFSHVLVLQSFVAPPGTTHSFLGGLGALGFVQVFILLSAVFFLTRCIMATPRWLVKIIALLMLLVVVSVLLEELDFGSSISNLILGDQAEQPLYSPDDTGFESAKAKAERLARSIQLGGSAIVLGLFALTPLLMSASRNRTIILIRPPLWILATVALALIVTRLAFMLNGADLGTIEGVPGALTHDVAEFGEIVVYYLFLVYAAALHERIIARAETWAPRRGVTKA